MLSQVALRAEEQLAKLTRLPVFVLCRPAGEGAINLYLAQAEGRPDARLMCVFTTRESALAYKQTWDLGAVHAPHELLSQLRQISSKAQFLAIDPLPADTTPGPDRVVTPEWVFDLKDTLAALTAFFARDPTHDVPPGHVRATRIDP